MAPPPAPRLPVDERWIELGRIYEQAQRQLEEMIRLALEHDAEGTAEYRMAQLAAVLRALAALQRRAVPLAAGVVEASYRVGLHATNHAIGAPRIAFSGVHQDALEVLADNLVNKLNAAAVTVGRRTDDVLRRIGLRQVAVGLAAGDSRPDVSKRLADQLIRAGVTDATTALVDVGNKRWQLDTYAEMVARTTSREAVTAGTVNRLLEANRDLITISKHLNPCTICAPVAGRTYSLTGRDDRYPRIEPWQLPPLHPNCRHVVAPATVNFDDFERMLAAAGNGDDAAIADFRSNLARIRSRRGG